MFPLLAYLNFPHEKLFFLIYRELYPLCLTHLHVKYNRIIVSISVSHGSLENQGQQNEYILKMDALDWLTLVGQSSTMAVSVPWRFQSDSKAWKIPGETLVFTLWWKLKGSSSNDSQGINTSSKRVDELANENEGQVRRKMFLFPISS